MISFMGARQYLNEVNNEPYDHVEVDLDYATCNVPARYIVPSPVSTPVPSSNI